MDGRGDGWHNGRNRRRFRVRVYVRPDLPPAEERPNEIIAWIELILNHALNREGFDMALNVPQNNANNEHNDNVNNNDNIDNNDEANNNDDVDNNDNVNNDNVDNFDNNNENAEDEVAGGGSVVEAGVGVSQGVEGEDPLLGESRKRSREEEDEDIEERSSKRLRSWFDCSSDSDTDSADSGGNNTQENNRNSPVRHADALAEVAEEDPVPGPSGKRSRKRKHLEDDESSGPKSKRCCEFANSNSDTATASTSHDPAPSSCGIDLAEDAGAAEEKEEEGSQHVKEEDPQSKVSRKRPRKDDEEDGEDTRGKRRFKR